MTINHRPICHLDPRPGRPSVPGRGGVDHSSTRCGARSVPKDGEDPLDQAGVLANATPPSTTSTLPSTTTTDIGGNSGGGEVSPR